MKKLIQGILFYFLVQVPISLEVLPVSKSNWIDWRIIQGVIRQGRFEITSTITPEFYDTKLNY